MESAMYYDILFKVKSETVKTAYNPNNKAHRRLA